MLGQHTVKHWSSTQASVSLSSGEAEFPGVIRGAGQGLGYQAMLHDLGVVAPLRVWTDSSAAIGICSRQGLGKLRHLDAHTLWIQQAVRSGRVDLRKVAGETNPADLLTKHSLSRNKMDALVKIFGCRYLDGRASTAPMVRKGESTKMTMAQAEIAAVNGVPGGEIDGEPAPFMPHIAYAGDAARLDAEHPKIEAPDEDLLDDGAADERDGVYQHGLEIAAGIQRDAEKFGRLRRSPSSAKREYATTIHGKDFDENGAIHVCDLKSKLTNHIKSMRAKRGRGLKPGSSQCHGRIAGGGDEPPCVSSTPRRSVELSAPVDRSMTKQRRMNSTQDPNFI